MRDVELKMAAGEVPTWYTPDNAGEFWVGRAVGARALREKVEFGHIAGWGGRNSVGELLVLVRWENGEERPIHPGNLTLY